MTTGYCVGDKMANSSIVVFIVDGDFESLYITTPDRYSDILDKHNIVPERVLYKTIPLETIMLILDNKFEYILR